MSPTARRWTAAAAAGVAAGLLARFARGYPPELAAVTGVALGLFVFAILRTVERMRAATRRGERR